MDLNRNLAELRILENTYMATHPLVLEKKAEVERLLQKVFHELQSFIIKLEEEYLQNSFKISNISEKLQSLPNKEMQMAEMQRQQQVAAEIYAAASEKFNQAKVAETIEMADVYIMDYAVPPIPPPVDVVKIFALCMLLGIFVSFGPMIFFDMVSKTVRTEFELRRMTVMTVFESIPEIYPVKKSIETEGDQNQEKIAVDSEVEHDELFKGSEEKQDEIDKT
jgi:uncharacterized protein involved in exopolysaccharide biosynthesis